MSIKVVIGLQWGDEGKGKVVDVFSSDVEMVVRYQGGNNAGHTVVINDNRFIFHLIPTGILRKGIICLNSRGTVIDPESLLEEIDILADKGVSCKNRFFVSKYAHLVMPYHKLLDELMDRNKGSAEIGTTKRGIGPAYADKYYRCSLRIEDLLYPDILKAKIYSNLEIKNKSIADVYGGIKLNPQDIFNRYKAFGKRLEPYIKDCRLLINKYVSEGRNILYEGAQGTLLDIDYGTYPFVTSSNTSATGIYIAGELPAVNKVKVIGVLKAYTTRVGNGPFPTECNEKMSNILRSKGQEYGASTGRPRRCGWFDAFATKYTCELNRVNKIVLTKLDVLDGFEKLNICIGYRYKNKELKEFPASSYILSQVQPVYEEHPGWESSTKGVQDFNKLPLNARKYIERIEMLLKKKIDIISTGSKRCEAIRRKN